MGRKIKLKRRIIEALDLPMEAAFDVPRLTMLGTERALVENHKGIYEYYPSYVRLQTGCGMLRVGGEALALRELSTERLLISGAIASVEYENKM